MGHLGPAIFARDAYATQPQAGEVLQLAPGQQAVAVALCSIFPGQPRHLVSGLQGLGIILDQRRRE
ncbi:hypothetical protein D3C84_1210280 [compost metagenome]